MAVKFSGRVLYANGIAATGVQVRVFDKDAPGKIDDDLTVEPGVTDSNGHFTVSFAPSRYLDTTIIRRGGALSRLFDWSAGEEGLRVPDLTDILIPYLQFRYPYNQQICQHTASFNIFEHDYRLPEKAPLRFVPSQHGFKFRNYFTGYPLPFSVPELPGTSKVTKSYGLCGGMSSAAADFYLCGRPIPHTLEVPTRRTKLYQYIYRRAIDSFGGFGKQIVQVARWMTMPVWSAQGIQARTYREFQDIRARLDDQQPVLLTLIYEQAAKSSEILKKIWGNHQVLAYRYSEEPGGLTRIYVYDSNYPREDDVHIRTEKIIAGETGAEAELEPAYGLKSVQLVPGYAPRVVHGFFAMPYFQVEPPPGL